MKGHQFEDEILKECDIRGILNRDLTKKDAYYVGKAFGTKLKNMGKNNCVVGYDGRFSSPGLGGEAMRGLTETGIDVIDIGLVPTPVVYFAVSELYPGGGLIVTASHNPPEYNGFKFITEDGPFFAEDLKELADISRKASFIKGKGNSRKENIVPSYIKYLSGFIVPSLKHFSIVWDPGNGAAGATLPFLIDQLPGKHRVICGDVDGNFPNHHPDPSVESNVHMLQEAVKETKADFGIAFDGDGDRIGVVDSEGYLLQGDQLLTIYASTYLKETPGATVMTEVKASKMFHDAITAFGGRPLMWKVGHTNQKAKMLEQNIQLAGETSGHIYFGENYGYDDALFAALKLITILSKGGKSLTEIRKAFPVYHDTGEIRIEISKSKREKALLEITERLNSTGRQFLAIDGIRASCKNGFWIVRGSNTLPQLTIRCEGTSELDLEYCIKDLKHQLSLSGIILNNKLKGKKT